MTTAQKAKPVLKVATKDEVLKRFEIKTKHETINIDIRSGAWQGFSPYASVYYSGGGGRFNESLDSARSRFKELTAKGAIWTQEI